MNSLITKLSCLGLVGLTYISSMTAIQAQGLFPDKALEAAVRNEVFAKRYNQEPITAEDVKNISEVRAKGKGIENLEGLQHCVALQMVDFQKNKIANLEPMKGLKLLQQVILNENQIESIAPLEGLTQIQYLELSQNKVKDLGPLKGMANMRSLYLSDNQIASIEPIGECKKIWSLYLARNPVSDFAPIGNLKWLTHLDLQGCKLKKIDFLKPLTELRYLMLANNELTGVGPLVEMCQADAAGRKHFAPYLQLYLHSNPLNERFQQEDGAKLKETGVRLHTEPPKR